MWGCNIFRRVDEGIAPYGDGCNLQHLPLFSCGKNDTERGERVTKPTAPGTKILRAMPAAGTDVETYRPSTFRVIANQCAHWCGNPYSASAGNRHRLALLFGIRIPTVASLPRNDTDFFDKLKQTPVRLLFYVWANSIKT